MICYKASGQIEEVGLNFHVTSNLNDYIDEEVNTSTTSGDSVSTGRSWPKVTVEACLCWSALSHIFQSFVLGPRAGDKSRPVVSGDNRKCVWDKQRSSLGCLVDKRDFCMYV